MRLPVPVVAPIRARSPRRGHPRACLLDSTARRSPRCGFAAGHICAIFVAKSKSPLLSTTRSCTDRTPYKLTLAVLGAMGAAVVCASDATGGVFYLGRLNQEPPIDGVERVPILDDRTHSAHIKREKKVLGSESHPPTLRHVARDAACSKRAGVLAAHVLVGLALSLRFLSSRVSIARGAAGGGGARTWPRCFSLPWPAWITL